MANYIQLIGQYYPDAQAYCAGNPTIYSNIVWVSSAISQAELDGVHLTDYKVQKITSFGVTATAEIINGFVSSALGTPHWYDSELEDQINLIGAVATGSDMNYSSREYTQGFQVVDFGGAVVGTNSTGAVNDATNYNAEIVVDGSSTYISAAGSTIQTFDDLITQMNADADFGAVASAAIVSGDIEITSIAYGSSSTISIIDSNLFSPLTGYSSLQTAVVGIDGSTQILKEYLFHTNAQLLVVINDGKDVKLTTLQQFNVKKQQVLAAADEEAVDAITWD